MNPRYRRLLIPGLLTLLLVVVLVSSLANRARGAEDAPPHTVVSAIDDPRVTESSGLAVSTGHDDLAYTINDSGHDPLIFAVEISTGEVVGVTALAGHAIADPEALALDADGTLWVADTGDNAAVRDDIALYELDEPGRTTTTVTPARWPLVYAGGPRDVETLLIDPTSNRKFLVSKGLAAGELFEIPDNARVGAVTELQPASIELPVLITDGAFSPDGSTVLLRTYTAAHFFDPAQWMTKRSINLPPQQQGETVAYEGDGQTFLIGSEGARSELLRISVPEELPAEKGAEPEERTGEGIWIPLVLLVLSAVGIGIAGTVLAKNRRN